MEKNGTNLTLPIESQSFNKADNGKPPLAILRDFPFTMADVSRALTHGANKYGRMNWSNCDDLDRYFSACDRHIQAFYNGERLDPETGLSHLSHAICSLLFINEILRIEEVDE